MKNDAARQLQQLLKIGTARAGRAPIVLAAPLDALLLRDTAAAPDAALWLSLGALDLWERGGFVASGQPAPTPMPAARSETLRPCPLRAQAVLVMLLRGQHPAGLEAEWLRLLRRHGGRLPAHLLPKLLDAATRQPTLRAALLPVLGERGHWLARRQAAWSWAAAGADTEASLWDTGTPEQRTAALRDWRARDPEAARAALAAAWSGEPPELRAALLAALAVGLGPDDDTFLDAALDDRRKEVRAVAQRLLARLPESRFAQRMLDRLLPLLRLERPLLRAARIELTLPAAHDAATRRDGIGVSPHHGLGEKAGWVVDMLAAVDPQVWTRQFDRAPRACLALAEHSEFATVFVRGWALAVQCHAQADPSPGVLAWLRALTAWWLNAEPALREAVPDSLFDLAAARFSEDADGTSGALFDALPDQWIADGSRVRLLARLAAGSPDTWPAPLSRCALRRLQSALPALAGTGHPWLVRQLLSSLALVLDPATAATFEPVRQPDAQWQSAIDEFLDLVRLRHEMTLSFQEPA
jgi:hypothetical protein